MTTIGRPLSLAGRSSCWAVGGFWAAKGMTETRPLVSRMAYFTVEKSVTPCPRSSSLSSSTVKRFFRISRWLIFPFSMIMLGRPQRMARKRMLFMVSTESIMVTHSRVKMGTIPESRGMPKSCMGTAARSAMRRSSTSSEGSSSPTCRFPMRRIPVMMSRYRMTVRITPMTMSRPPQNVTCLVSVWAGERSFIPGSFSWVREATVKAGLQQNWAKNSTRNRGV